MNPINDAAEALDNFANGPGADAANALADIFEQAGDRIAGSLELTSSIAGVTAGASSPVTVNLNMAQPSGKSAGPQASSTQIAAQVAQAVTRAQTRN